METLLHITFCPTEYISPTQVFLALFAFLPLAHLPSPLSKYRQKQSPHPLATIQTLYARMDYIAGIMTLLVPQSTPDFLQGQLSKALCTSGFLPYEALSPPSIGGLESTGAPILRLLQHSIFLVFALLGREYTLVGCLLLSRLDPKLRVWKGHLPSF